MTTSVLFFVYAIIFGLFLWALFYFLRVKKDKVASITKVSFALVALVATGLLIATAVVTFLLDFIVWSGR